MTGPLPRAVDPPTTPVPPYLNAKSPKSLICRTWARDRTGLSRAQSHPGESERATVGAAASASGECAPEIVERCAEKLCV